MPSDETHRPSADAATPESGLCPDRPESDGLADHRLKKNVLDTFRTRDGRRLAYVIHEPYLRSSSTAFVYVHGIESHSGWFDRSAGLLKKCGYPVFCIDRRGSGINRENRGCVSGHVPPGVNLLDDLDAAIAAIRARGPFESLCLIGLSWGGKCALAYTLRHPDAVDGLILITPGIKPKVDLSFRDKVKVLVHYFVSPERRHRIPIDPEMFTTTPRHLRYIEEDPLRLESVSAAFLWQSRRMDKLLKRAPSFHLPPMLVFLAGKDRIIDNEATRRFFSRLRDGPTILEYPDQTHSIQLDAPERLTSDIAAWVQGLRTPS